jgi:hypothetical protein
MLFARLSSDALASVPSPVSFILSVAQLLDDGMGTYSTWRGGKDARSTLGLVLQSSIRCEVKTAVPFLETRHLLE